MSAQSPGEIVSEQVLEREKALSDDRAITDKWLKAAAIAIPAIYRIAATGNVQAKAAAVEIHGILHPLPGK